MRTVHSLWQPDLWPSAGPNQCDCQGPSRCLPAGIVTLFVFLYHVYLYVSWLHVMCVFFFLLILPPLLQLGPFVDSKHEQIEVCLTVHVLSLRLYPRIPTAPRSAVFYLIWTSTSKVNTWQCEFLLFNILIALQIRLVDHEYMWPSLSRPVSQIESPGDRDFWGHFLKMHRKHRGWHQKVCLISPLIWFHYLISWGPVKERHFPHGTL